jgi:hypothetical protein
LPKIASALPALVLMLSLSIGLSACAGDTTAKEAAAAPSASATSAPAPSPAPSYASEKQLASFVAGYEKSWREVAESAAECRLYWVLDDDTTHLDGLLCWLQAQTLETEADTAATELLALTPPPSMESITNELYGILTFLSVNDAAETCGQGDIPINSDECNTKLGRQNTYLQVLETNLDKWGPYM